ncbi:hypothetical protein HL653_07045 [Sphingomonas sp. AP4-R1]|uniref:hypothetical protein n=1 Tax=Sphingomonas sp. AP4-R1 TaxID=2735134 RepID=UPI0014934786|nr:hypothetical protein [Sphingomonas sp. AP4-R1]QJU56359.1 hypothetical protein HL653_07045 [Sphingomonas sp. AP4-R1]
MSTESELCRARAAQARAEADAATLANVRERCLRAEAAWIAMAEHGERADVMRATLAAAREAAE